jgi:hypothetical protein
MCTSCGKRRYVPAPLAQLPALKRRAIPPRGKTYVRYTGDGLPTAVGEVSGVHYHFKDEGAVYTADVAGLLATGNYEVV